MKAALSARKICCTDTAEYPGEAACANDQANLRDMLP